VAVFVKLNLPVGLRWADLNLLSAGTMKQRFRLGVAWFGCGVTSLIPQARIGGKARTFSSAAVV